MKDERDERDQRDEHDDALDRALASYSQEPLAGIEHRVLLGVFSAANRSSRRWGRWIAVAASVASAGIIVWTNAAHVSDVQKTSSPTVASQPAKADVAVTMSSTKAPKLEKMTRPSETKRGLNMTGAMSPQYLREDAIRIEPIDIAPLVISPIKLHRQRTNGYMRKAKTNEDNL